MKKAQESQKAKALWKMKRREKNTTTPRVKTISKEETRQDQHFGKSTSKIQLVRWTKALKCVDREASNSFIGDAFQISELKDESDASDGYQASKVKNGALHVIGVLRVLMVVMLRTTPHSI